MSVENKRFSFVDTNILVYAFDNSQSHKHQTAQLLLNELMEEDRLRISTQVLQELFVTLTRKVARPCSAQEAIRIMNDLTAWPVMVVDYDSIRTAGELIDRAKISFWDALIVVSAVKAGATTLYTEDLNDGQEILGVQIRNPFR